MKRRTFFKVAAAGSAALAAGCRPSGERTDHTERGRVTALGGKSLPELRDRYRRELFDRYLPNMERYVVDDRYGGFMTTVDIRSGERISDAKRAWYEGRGIWAWSFLFNHLRQEERYLEIARRSVEFILRHTPQDGEFWIGSFSRSGEPLSGPGDIYGSLFVSEGLAEYAFASGEERYYEQARQILLDCMERYDSPDYRYHIGYLHPDAPEIPGTRVLGHWMIFLNSATQMLRRRDDPRILQVADRCVDAIMNHHMNSRYALLNEGLNHDLSLPDNEFAQFAYTGHGIETLWMVLHEAIRRRDRNLFETTHRAFRRHVEVARDPVYGGYFRSLDHVDDFRWKTDKVLWLQEEVLIGALTLVEHTADPWAITCFEQTDAYVSETFVRPEWPFWIHAGDRTVTDHPVNRVEHYHHPRHLMLNLLAVERMIGRDGRVSDLFS